MAPRIPLPAAAAVIALATAACASPSLGRYEFQSVEGIARESIEGAANFEPKAAPHPWYLRFRFSSRTNLTALAPERDAIAVKAGVCPLGEAEAMTALGPYSVGQSLAVRARTPEGGVAPGLARVIEKDARGRYLYTAYVVTDPARPPADVCLQLQAEGGPRGPERSNVIVAPAAAVKQALAQAAPQAGLPTAAPAP